ncbi:hypothetical protein BS47DRAFT_969987 [Hydnum rufescens UP504]|uniref:Uncharacterized protein n=1 Tax=Hydnum rufescens UP504 TaxID=1448309 RepID=A0A9P6DW77_9AGAM|nr:hypothetical protein BS47DRAFT_969987 [Hydnum rufescens UP504]
MSPRFERRSKDAPMDFTYDSPDVDRMASGAWSPFKEALAQSRMSKPGAQGPNSNPSSLLFSSSSNASPFQFGGKDSTVPSSSNSASVFSFEPRTPWAPPPSFSPQKVFPTSPGPDNADVSMSTAGSPTPEASPSTRTRHIIGNEVALGSPISPLRRSAYKARERDRSRERERERGRRRGLIPSRRDESDISDDENVCHCQLGV